MQFTPQCLTCKWFHRAAFKDGAEPTCEAFKEGVPTEVFDNERDHRRPVAGDGGTRYEAMPDWTGSHPLDEVG